MEERERTLARTISSSWVMTMADLIFVALTVVFFAGTWAFVRLSDGLTRKER